MKKQTMVYITTILISYVMMVSGCSKNKNFKHIESSISSETTQELNVQDYKPKNPDTKTETDIKNNVNNNIISQTVDIINSYFNQADVATYYGEPSIIVNDNIPFFTLENEGMQPTDSSWEYYNQLDNLGRTQIARANLSQETMPTKDEKRGEIGHIKPAGWHTSNYRETDVEIDGNYLYNRCHLIGWQLSGENDNPLNLITGTRYLNVEGMLPYENMIADYIHATGNSVLYRVTPCYNGDNLVCDGILLEAMSVQEPEIFAFCVYCYNVQPGVCIDYATGENWPESNLNTSEITTDISESNDINTAEYAVNLKNGKIHIVGNCSATDENSKSYMINPKYFNTYEAAKDYSIYIAPDQNNRNCGNCW